MAISNTAESLKAKFYEDDLVPELEALDLMTSFHCTMRFLEISQAAIFDPQQRNRPIQDVYQQFLASLGEITTTEDVPSFWSGAPPGPNENQAIRNMRMPMGMGALAAYLSMNLARGKEIVAGRIPNKGDKETRAAWHIDKFEELEDTRPSSALTVAGIVTRLRNAISHHQFKLRVLPCEQESTSFRDRVYVSFLDHSENSTFYARASFRTLELLMEKLRMAEYEFHQCPEFQGDAYATGAIETYVESCFSHFARGYRRHRIDFRSISRLDPESEYRLMLESSSIEISRSDTCKYAVEFSANGRATEPQYIDIPFLDPARPGSITILGQRCHLGQAPMDWMLYNVQSPLYRLDKKIKRMFDNVLASLSADSTRNP